MRVRMKIKVSGLRNDQEWPEVGGEIDLPDEEAAGYCAHGYCIPVDTRDQDIETRQTPKRRSRKTASV